ncbi:MAG: acyltransferase, partial [Actinomycetota bacterium]|nr:acyltransferase [Actinomycetota bacterium]
LAHVLSMNAYTVYLIHASVIVALAYTLSGVTVSALLKFALVAPLAVGLCFVLSHVGVRRLPRATSIV